MRKQFLSSRIFSLLICLFLIFATAVMIHSCKKDSKPETSLEISENKKDPATSSKTDTVPKTTANKYAGPCPYECDDPRCVNYSEPCTGGGGGGGTVVKPMTAIFQNINYTQLQQLLNANDSVAVENFLYPLANQIADQIQAKYGENIRDEIGDFPQAMVMLGLFEYGKENNISLDEQTLARMADPYGCFTAALGGIIGINDIRGVYQDFLHGVSPRTVVRTLKTFGKRIFTGIAIGFAVVELAICLDWI